jgi:hypothetical protein
MRELNYKWSNNERNRERERTRGKKTKRKSSRDNIISI